MSLSKKPRHWIALAVAIAALVLAFLDLFGALPDSGFLQKIKSPLLIIMGAFICLNLSLDAKEPKQE